MGFLRRLLLTGTVIGAALAVAVSARAQSMDDLAPYKMIRSLQFVQDTVVLGDHSAMEMQRFLLATIDERLRTADLPRMVVALVARDELVERALSALHLFQLGQHYIVTDGKIGIVDESTGRVMPDRQG